MRENFWTARTFTDLADLNAQADVWCVGQADDRLCPQDRTLTMGQAFVQEQPRLLRQAAPASQELLNQAGARGEKLGCITMTLLRLVDRYGAAEVQTAISAALVRGVPHPNAVHLALETQREARQMPAPVDIQLSAKVRQRDGAPWSQRVDSR